MREKPKLMIVSRGLAPMVFGGTIILNNLLTDYPGTAVGVSGPVDTKYSDPGFAAACKTYYHNLINTRKFTIYYDKLMKYFPFLLRWYIYDKIRKEKPDVIMAPVPEPQYFVEAYKAARKFGIPFYAHTHDLWQENHAPGTWPRELADEWEKEILTHAAKVLCMTDVQKEHYEKKYHITCHVFPHTVTRETISKAPVHANASDKNTILFTGTVSTLMNLDALKVIGEASAKLKVPHTLLCCTTWSKEEMESRGITSPSMKVTYVSRAEVQEIQSKAAVLLAPLSHKNGAMEEVRTVFSTKILEYLVAGRPILVFGPKDCFHALSARKSGWAYVVDEDSPDALANAIEKLMNDDTLAESVVQGALAEARRRLAQPFAEQLYKWVQQDSTN